MLVSNFIVIPGEVFTPESVDGFSLDSEWLQISSNPKDSSKYSDQSQQCCSSNCLPLSYYFQILQSLYQSFGDCTENTNYKWYHRHFHVLSFLLFASKVKVLISLRFLLILHCRLPERLNPPFGRFYFYCRILRDVFVSQNPRIKKFSRTDSELCIYHLSVDEFQFLAQFPVDHLSHSFVCSLILFLR